MKKLLSLLIIIAALIGIAALQPSATADNADDGKRNVVVSIVAKYFPFEAENLTAWYDKNIVYADNPTDSALTFKLDEKAITLAAHQTQKLILEPGQHRLELADGKVVEFTQREGTNRSILNPTASPYFFWKTVYGSVNLPLEYKTVTIAGKPYEGPFEVSNEYLITRIGNQPWRFGLDESIPDTVAVNNDRNTYTLIFSKAYRLPDFINAYPMLSVQ
ncbi:hypothetical protein [Rodentibacter pneumotropicus]|uniref:hypothetical protein n=1 Tax=Rodentibacter pneumotropicus TaxID=758 RepID=UPI00037D7E93|nr:hypothetical protein [Rodentibacter pneumotropicus]NBH74959.1 hypothetical protein [Rodentibacter pneumotropicus]OOF63939.1 hypothetical protein BH925_00855 [Rodentibacter pneumotropicus]THA04315.1 hypothetical protein D3M72_01375 [Rodentibacter pneumotropicus]THA04979.1 hypothetical protein D3M73_08695 [Rodentibacter pneumotropicus]THA13450.1 hypothetical protein D3M81_02345 [Rodentibacter pneumotropicus]